MNKVITGHDPTLIKSLEAAGILPDQCKRVIIDIDYTALVTIYFECYGDERLYNIDLGMHIKKISEQQDPHCEYCNGSGSVAVDTTSILDRDHKQYTSVTCKKCNGTGKAK